MEHWQNEFFFIKRYLQMNKMLVLSNHVDFDMPLNKIKPIWDKYNRVKVNDLSGLKLKLKKTTKILLKIQFYDKKEKYMLLSSLCFKDIIQMLTSMDFIIFKPHSEVLQHSSKHCLSPVSWDC